MSSFAARETSRGLGPPRQPPTPILIGSGRLRTPSRARNVRGLGPKRSKTLAMHNGCTPGGSPSAAAFRGDVFHVGETSARVKPRR